MQKNKAYKLITCISAVDKAQEAMRKLESEMGIQAVTNYFARGLGRSSASTKSLGQQTEKTIFTALVPAHQADEIFEFIYHAADLHRPHGGIIYITTVKQSNISPHIDSEALETSMNEGAKSLVE